MEGCNKGNIVKEGLLKETYWKKDVVKKDTVKGKYIVKEGCSKEKI